MRWVRAPLVRNDTFDIIEKCKTDLEASYKRRADLGKVISQTKGRVAAGRNCRGIELNPLYVQVVMERFEAHSKWPAVLKPNGETFAQSTARRQIEMR